MKEVLQCECRIFNVHSIGDSSIYPKMLKSSGPHLNNRGTTHLVNSFCYTWNKWCKQMCIGNTLQKEEYKSVNIFSNFNISKKTSARKIGDQPNK